MRYKEFTMIPDDAFLLNLELCEKFLHIKGDIVECGVWKGGMSAAMADLSEMNKKIHLFDSFEGLPPAEKIDGEEALNWEKDVTSPNYRNNSSANESFAIEALKIAGNTNYKLYKGWFQNTLNEYEGNQISILRLDGDWYKSIIVCLEKLFPLVSKGGLIIIDDYYVFDGCAKAVHDYLSEKKSSSRIYQFRDRVAYIIKKD